MLIALTIGTVASLLLAVLLTPRVVEYVEVVEINGQPERIYNAIRYQSQLMKWSAWPSETGSSCQVAGEDGAVGAQILFFDKKGRQFGHQSVEHLAANSWVEFSLMSKGPPHLPRVVFYIVPSGSDRGLVLLHFRNDILPPFHLLLRLFGVVRWTRQMHQKDLDGLKRYVERSEDYLGRWVKEAA